MEKFPPENLRLVLDEVTHADVLSYPKGIWLQFQGPHCWVPVGDQNTHRIWSLQLQLACKGATIKMIISWFLKSVKVWHCVPFGFGFHVFNSWSSISCGAGDVVYVILFTRFLFAKCLQLSRILKLSIGLAHWDNRGDIVALSIDVKMLLTFKLQIVTKSARILRHLLACFTQALPTDYI